MASSAKPEWQSCTSYQTSTTKEPSKLLLQTGTSLRSGNLKWFVMAVTAVVQRKSISTCEAQRWRNYFKVITGRSSWSLAGYWEVLLLTLLPLWDARNNIANHRENTAYTSQRWARCFYWHFFVSKSKITSFTSKLEICTNSYLAVNSWAVLLATGKILAGPSAEHSQQP